MHGLKWKKKKTIPKKPPNSLQINDTTDAYHILQYYIRDPSKNRLILVIVGPFSRFLCSTRSGHLLPHTRGDAGGFSSQPFKAKHLNKVLSFLLKQNQNFSTGAPVNRLRSVQFFPNQASALESPKYFLISEHSDWWHVGSERAKVKTNLPPHVTVICSMWPPLRLMTERCWKNLQHSPNQWPVCPERI